MPDFLTRRNGTWHCVRRVPAAFAQLDPRGIIKPSTRVKVADDRTGRLLYVAYTTRGEVIRIISARGTEPHERRQYHEDNA
jgi:uncharacterized DUF497 family protein